MVRLATINIVCYGRRVIKEKFMGIVRLHDVQATYIDKVDMYMSFFIDDKSESKLYPHLVKICVFPLIQISFIYSIGMHKNNN